MLWKRTDVLYTFGSSPVFYMQSLKNIYQGRWLKKETNSPHYFHPKWILQRHVIGNKPAKRDPKKNNKEAMYSEQGAPAPTLQEG